MVLLALAVFSLQEGNQYMDTPSRLVRMCGNIISVYMYVHKYTTLTSHTHTHTHTHPHTHILTQDEYHSRLKFSRRGLVGMANAGKDDNGSQFFFTLGRADELTKKHTLFAKVHI